MDIVCFSDDSVECGDGVRILTTIADLRRSQYEQSGQMHDLEEAIDIAQKAVKWTPLNSPDLAVCLSTLSTLRSMRYERTESEQDWQMAIDTARQAARSVPCDPMIQTGSLKTLTFLLQGRYWRTGENKFLEEAIDMTRQAILLTSLDHPSRAMYLSDLGALLAIRYERFGEMKDLEECIYTAGEAVQSNALDQSERAAHLNNLGSTIRLKYNRTGEMQCLEDAIAVAQQAVQLMAVTNPNRAACLNGLSNSLLRRYERTGDPKDLQEAIDAARHAVESTALDHQYRAMYLSNLGGKLGIQYDRTGEIETLEEAVDTAQEAVQSMSIDCPDRGMYLDILANLLGSRFKRTGQVRDLKEAIGIIKKAGQLTPLDHPDLAGRLNNLGIILGSQYERAGNVEDLDEAINAIQESIQSTPVNHPDLASRLNTFGGLLKSRYERTEQTEDLQKVISIARQVVQSTPPDHPDWSMYSSNLGNILESLYEQTGDLKDLEDIARCYSKAFDCVSAIPLIRLKAAAHCLSKLADLRKLHEGVKLGRDALALLPTVHTRNLNRSDQQFVISGFAGIASDLCALLLSEGRVHEAVERLEQGRAIIISRLLDDRSDISGLSREHPELAQRYQSLVAELNTPFGTAQDDSTKTAKVMQRRKAAADLEACLQDIRATSGYDRFLLGNTVAQMQEVISEGCVIIVNVSTIRSDALVMTQKTLKAICLPNLNVEIARRWLRTEWRSKRRSEMRKKNDQFLEYLTWLWHVCVKHILEHVSTFRGGKQALPRVWWIGCGLASSMPFHAAGIHVNASQDNALNKVISSYTPSVKALIYARGQMKHAQNDQPTQNQMLVTLMPETPRGAHDEAGFCALKGVHVEEEKIARIVSPHVNLVVRTSPDADDILGRLEKYQISHFACHGISSIADPSSSGLVLQRLASDGTLEQDYLSVYRISQLQLKHAKIAYLSACSTAENKGAKLRDEVIHIVSGFQVAGFPHVIGSLWPAGDKECVDVASGFYSKLFEHQGWPDMGSRRIAWALQEAVMAVRAQDMDMPLNWAQFVHFGA